MSLVLRDVFFSLLIFGIKRKNLWPGCCFQRPGAPSPGNLITSRKNRLAYTLIFGLTVETVFLIIFEPDSVPLAIPLSYINWDSFGMGWITRKILAINFYAIFVPIWHHLGGQVGTILASKLAQVGVQDALGS